MVVLFVRLPCAHAQNVAGKLSTATAQPTKNTALQAMKNQSLTFIENKGQWNPEARYLARTNGANVWITNTSIVYDFYRLEHCETNDALPKSPRLDEPFSYRNPHPELDTTSRRLEHVVKMSFVGVSPEARAAANNKQAGYFNYFIGNDQTAWATEVPLYSETRIENLYPGVSARLYEENGSVRYDLIADAGADVHQIVLAFEGAESARVNPNGDLALQTSLGEVTHGKLFVYQLKNGKRKQIDCRFVMKEAHHVSFALGEYDRSLPLVIDPLIYTTFLGGSIDDHADGIAVDGTGAAYICGYTVSTNYPTTVGAYKPIYGTDYEGFITKVNPMGVVAYSTFIGGSSTDWPNAITVDVSGAAYVTGYTGSSNFPTTAGAFQNTYSGMQDIFITKLNATGSALTYSTYLGVSGTEDARSIAADTFGAVYVTGYTTSPLFPTTAGAIQSVYGGFYDCFVTKLSPSGSSLIYSTLLGGISAEIATNITVDASNAAYITGQTRSVNFPTTPGVFQKAFTNIGDSSDCFVAKINPSGTALLYSTFLGGSAQDISEGIAVDASGAAYIVGTTTSKNFPTTSGASAKTIGGYQDVFVTKINAIGSELVYSTFLGGSFPENARDIKVDASGAAYIVGNTDSKDFPTTQGALQPSSGGMQDAFIAKLNPAGTALDYATFLGGSEFDDALSLAVEPFGSAAYITGYTISGNFPSLSSTVRTTANGRYDSYITKLTLIPVLPPLWSSSSSINFGSVQVNTASTTQSYTLIGTNLTANVRVTASNGFEIGTSPGDNFGSVLILSPSNGSLSQTIYVRFTPASAGRAGGSITHTSGEAYFSVAVLGVATNPVSVRSSYPQASGVRIAVAPHPITDQTRLTIELRTASSVEVNIFDALGQLVQQRLLGTFAEGVHEIAQTMNTLPTGTYTVVVRAGTEQATKMIQHIR